MTGTVAAEAVAAVSTDLAVAAARLAVSIPSPPGAERELAEAMLEFARERVPGATWELQPVGAGGANLLGAAGSGDSPELCLYGHLDTSLDGDPARDAAVTGDPSPYPPFTEGAGTVSGFGVSVSKAPAATALAGFAAAIDALGAAPFRLSLLLAAGGTHRADPEGTAPPPGFGAGVTTALAGGYYPAAVLNAKAGAPGVLHEEPGAAFVAIELRGAAAPVLLRARLAPEGGVIARAGDLIAAFEEWRGSFVGPRSAQCAREAAVGSLRAGRPDKPDLLPAVLRATAYIILLPDDDPGGITAGLERHLRARLGDGCRASVFAAAPGAATRQAAPVVRIAREVWQSRFGAGSDRVEGWTGSTDGVVFRARGIDTVRMGFQTRPDPADPRLDLVDVETMERFAGMYAEAAVRWAATGGRGE